MMMKYKPEIEKKIEDTLNSINDIQRVNPKPFFIARLQSRLENSRKRSWDNFIIIISRPAIAIAIMIIIILLNMTLLIRNPEPSIPITDQEEQAFADEYNLTVATLYEYENPETSN